MRLAQGRRLGTRAMALAWARLRLGLARATLAWLGVARTEYSRIFSQSVNYLAIHDQLGGTVVDNVQPNITVFVSSLASRQDGARPSYEVRVLLAGWRAS